MDIKIEIKEEIPFSDDFSEDVTVKFENDAAVWGKFYEMDIKTEIKEEVLDSDFSSPNKEHFFSEDAVMKVNEHCEIDKIGINEALEWLERSSTEYPCVADVSKDLVNESIPSTESIRLYGEELSVLFSEKSLGKNTRLNMTKNRSQWDAARKHRSKEIDVSKISSLEESVYSELDAGEMSRKSCLKHNDFSQQNDPQKHHFLVTDNTGYDYKCNICELRFTSSSDLKTHKFTHEGKNLYISNIYDKNAQLSQLRKHKLINVGIKPLKCESCAKGFVQVSQLNKHRLTHEGIRPHKCDTCGRGFGYLSHLRKHKWTHTVTKPYKCDTCGKCFARLSDLKRHEHLKPVKCDICGKSYVHLKSHKLTHEGIKPLMCEICGKGFVFMSQFKQHKLIHEGIKPHKCDTCGKCFIQFSQLKTHKKVHERAKAIKM